MQAVVSHIDQVADLALIKIAIVPADVVPVVIERMVEVYLGARLPDEDFIAAVRRLGTEPFKAAFLKEISHEAA